MCGNLEQPNTFKNTSVEGFKRRIRALSVLPLRHRPGTRRSRYYVKIRALRLDVVLEGRFCCDGSPNEPSLGMFSLTSLRGQGGLSLFGESATLHEGFTKASWGLREGFAERVFEKASRSLQGASTNPSRRFTHKWGCKVTHKCGRTNDSVVR